MKMTNRYVYWGGGTFWHFNLKLHFPSQVTHFSRHSRKPWPKSHPSDSAKPWIYATQTLLQSCQAIYLEVSSHFIKFPFWLTPHKQYVRLRFKPLNTPSILVCHKSDYSVESIKITKLYSQSCGSKHVWNVDEIKGSDSDHAVLKYICFSNDPSPEALYSVWYSQWGLQTAGIQAERTSLQLKWDFTCIFFPPQYVMMPWFTGILLCFKNINIADHSFNVCISFVWLPHYIEPFFLPGGEIVFTYLEELSIRRVGIHLLHKWLRFYFEFYIWRVLYKMWPHFQPVLLHIWSAAIFEVASREPAQKSS